MSIKPMNINSTKQKIKAIMSSNSKIINEFPNSENFAKGKYRKAWVTVIHVDIVDSTNLYNDYSEIKVAKIISTFQEGVSDILRHYDFKHIQIQGDGIFGVLHTPYQNKSNSIEAMLHINGFLNKLWRKKYINVEYKAGINTGKELMIVVGKEEYKDVAFVGGVVNDTFNMVKDSKYINKFILSSLFVSNNEDALFNKNQNRNWFDSNGNGEYSSGWYYKIWEN